MFPARWRTMTCLVAGLGLTLILIPACQPGTTDGPPAKKQLRPVSARLDWLLRGHTLPLVVAKEKGFYEKRGIDVTLSEGRGDSLTCELVSNGKEIFGMADASTGALAISKGANIRYVAVFVQKTPSSIIFYPDQSIEKPGDLKGKKGGVSPAGAATVLLNAVLGKYGIRQDEVNLAAMDPHSKHAALLGKNVDYINGYILGDYLSVMLEDPSIQAVPYFSWEINALSTGLITHLETIEKDPDLVRDFVEATVEGWNYTVEQPEEASSIGVKHFPLSDQTLLEKGIQATLPLLHTPNSEDKPLGWMAEEDWKQTVELMHRYGGSDPPRELDHYFTNQFFEPR
jgi:NitT/TauT family transport system substrate-binding protein